MDFEPLSPESKSLVGHGPVGLWNSYNKVHTRQRGTGAEGPDFVGPVVDEALSCLGNFGRSNGL